MKKLKYNNSITTVNNIKFHSKKEARRYEQLLLMEKAGLIKDLKLQPEYELIPRFKKNNKTYRKTCYFADFSYIDVKLDMIVVEDVKGRILPLYSLKKKLFEYRYPDMSITEIK